MDYPFEKKLSFGFSPLILSDEYGDSLTDFGELRSIAIGQEWPMTNCLDDGSTPSEVSYH
jgi:hypothetical protein